MSLANAILLRRGHAPHRVAKVVRNQQAARGIDRQAYRTAAGFFVGIQESSHDILRRSVGLAQPPEFGRLVGANGPR